MRPARAPSTDSAPLCGVEHGLDTGLVLDLKELYLNCTLEEYDDLKEKHQA